MAATIIDELIVTLGLDPKQFTDAQKGVMASFQKLGAQSERQAKAIEENGKKATQFFTALTKGATEFLAVFTAGLGATEFVHFLTAADTGLGRLSQRLGISAKDLGAWGSAATLLGGTTAGMSQSIQSLITRFANISITGDTSLIPFLRALHVNFKTAKDGTLDWQDALYQMSDTLSHMPRARATTFLQDMGIGDPGTINLMLQGSAAMRQMVASLKQFAPNQADIKAAEARQMAFSKLELSAIEVGRTLLTQLTPALDGVADALTRLGEWASAHPAILDAVFAGAATIVIALGAALTALSFTAVVAGFAALATPIGLITIAIAGLAAAAVFVVEKWDWLRSQAKAIWDAIAGIIHTALEPVIAVMRWLDPAAFAATAAPKTAATAKGGGYSGRGYVQQQSDIAQLVGMGWTRAQAQGIVANISRESGGNPAAVGDMGAAYGLGQWHPDRQAAFKAWSGHDIRNSTRAEQLAFITYEMRHGSERTAGAALSKATSAGQAAAIVSRLYERPANGAYEAALRSRMAMSLAGAGSGAVPQGGGTNAVTIGSITVQTQATDATGIAKDIRAALGRQLAASNANGGFS